MSIFYSIVLQNTKKNCWKPCKKKQGRCSYCGTRGMCCRKGWKDKSGGCDGTFGGKNHHNCVLKPRIGMFLKRKDNKRLIPTIISKISSIIIMFLNCLGWNRKPGNYLQVCTSTSGYRAKKSDELSFEKGANIYVILRNGGGW